MDAAQRMTSPSNGLCSIKGCDKKHHATGLCPAHYVRRATGRNLHTPIREYTKSIKPATAPRVEKPQQGKQHGKGKDLSNAWLKLMNG